MANIFLDVAKGVEVAAEDVLKFIGGATGGLNKVAQAEPGAVAALGTILGAVSAAVSAVAGAVENPLNISLDVATVTALKAVWPDVVTFAGDIGIRL